MAFPQISTWIDWRLFGYNIIAGAGVALPKRPVLNFLAPFTVTDNPTLNTTDIAGGGGGLPWDVVDVATTTPPADTTGATDATTAFNDANTTAGEGGWVFAPGWYNNAGGVEYQIAGTITLGDFGQQQLIASPAAAFLTPGTSNAIDAYTNEPGSVSISGFVFQGPDSVNSGQMGIKSRASSLLVENCQFEQFDTGIEVYGGNATISGCNILSGGTGIIIHDGAIPSTITGNNFAVNTNAQIDVGSSNPTSAVIQGNTFNVPYGGIGVLGGRSRGSILAGNLYGIASGGVGVQWDSNSWGNVVLDATSDGGTAIVDQNGGNFPSQVGPDSPIASASTIAPVGRIEFISGTTPIETITVPTNTLDATSPMKMVLIFEGAGSFLSTGNISRAGTFVAGQRVELLYIPAEEVWFW